MAVTGTTARFGAYVYINAPGQNDRARHYGGVAVATADLGADGWRLTSYEFTQLWDRDETITSDRMREAGVGGLPKLVWSSEGKREIQRDEEEVAQLMSRYTWCYDLGDFETMKDVFHEDTDSSFHMGESVYNIGRDQMLAMIMKNRAETRYSQHHIYNTDVKIGLDGNSAFVRCYAQTRRTQNDAGAVVMAGGHYFTHARRYNGQWKFDSFRYHRAYSPQL